MRSERRSRSLTWRRAPLLGGAAAMMLGLGAGSAGAQIIPADRRIDWDPGVRGGIPAVPVGRDAVADCGAAADGSSDAAPPIQQCIDQCPAGQAVFLPAGTYRLDAPLQLRSSVVLRGAGPDQTRLENHATDTGDIISLFGSEGSVSTAVTSGLTRGSTELVVADASGIAVGDYVQLSQDNDPSVVDTVGCSGDCTWCARTVAQAFVVAGKSGNTLTIGRPLYVDYSASFNPQLRKFDWIHDAGVEDLYLERLDGAGSYHETNNIQVSYGVNCWVKNVESARPVGAHVRLEDSHACEVRGSYFHHGHTYDGGRAYGVFLIGRNTDVLVENNVLEVVRHAMILEVGGQGNVFGYNYSKDPLGNPGDHWLFSDIATHGAHPMMNLWEGNIAAHVDFDATWGSGSRNTVFRSWIERRAAPPDDPDIWTGLYAVEVEAKNTEENVVGNVLCNEECASDGSVLEHPDGASSSQGAVWRLGFECSASNSSDPNVAATLLRHGNFDYVSGATSWDPSIPDQDLPDSLYLDGKPAFFGCKPWPAIGPDLDPMLTSIPAYDRVHGDSGELPTGLPCGEGGGGAGGGEGAMGGAGGTPGGGGQGASAAASEDDSGCSCRLSAGHEHRERVAWLLLGAAVWVGRRRRRM